MLQILCRCLVLSCIALLAPLSALAGTHTERVPYKIGEKEFLGFVAYDDQKTGKRPGVLLVHDWTGNNEYIQKRAEQVAQLGYVAFAVDLYGKGRQAKDHKEAAALAGIMMGKSRALVRERMRAGHETLAAMPEVDASRIATIGYCFGGLAVLEHARSGANVRGTASFHGILETPKATLAKKMPGAVLVMTGDQDPMVPTKQVAAFSEEMRRAKADWQLVTYGQALHAFTVPTANEPKKGMAYNHAADMRSWSLLVDFLAETLGEAVH